MSEPTPYEKFRALAKKVVSVPKGELDKRKRRPKKRRVDTRKPQA